MSETRKQIKSYGNYLWHYIKVTAKWITKRGFRNNIFDLLLIVIIVSFIIIVYRELKTVTVLIEPFDVPKELEEKGYNGRVIVNKLKDQLNRINTESRFNLTLDTLFSSGNENQNNEIPRIEDRNTSCTFTLAWLQAEQLKVEIPGVGISLQAIIQYIRKVFNVEPALIKGEVAIRKNQIFITTRVGEKIARTIPEENQKAGNVDENLAILDDMLLKTAEYIYENTKPIILAKYFYAKNKESECIDTLEKITSQKSNVDSVTTAYNIWGYILTKQGKYDDAIAKYLKAIKLVSSQACNVV